MNKLANNKAIRENFVEMVSKRKNDVQRAICICGEDGKGKTTTINFLHQYCKNNNIKSVCINFKFYNFKRRREFFDHFSDQLETFFPKGFKKYKDIKVKIQNSNNSNTILKNVNIQGSLLKHIGSNINCSDENTISVLTDKFLEDFKKLSGDFVVFFDHIESLDDELRSFIVDYFVFKNRNNKSFLVFSWENLSQIRATLDLDQGIRLFELPYAYDISDWYDFCDAYCDGDEESKMVVRRSYEKYKNNPTFMRICLGGFEY